MRAVTIEAMSGEIVRATDVKRRYGPNWALRGVNLSVKEAEIVALLGPNGSGKTTLLRILATLAQPTSGEVLIFGLSPRVEGPRIRNRLSFLGHNPGLYDDLTALENLRFFARVYGVKVSETRLKKALAEFGLETRMDDLVSSFSRGMKQRLALARSALHEARLYLWDEPLTGLDSRAVDTVIHAMDRIRDSGAAVIFSSHILPSPLPRGTRIVYLEDGRVTEKPQVVLMAVSAPPGGAP
jgi:heme ABC exporter ATP-binding subunit CcmA